MADMNPAITKMLERYNLSDDAAAFEALREILQEIVLLGLHDAGFFDHALFYGGTALRILYGLPRFSEDLDFSLMKPDSDFDLRKYEKSVTETLASFGFEVEITTKAKASSVQSAFLKGNTVNHLININVPIEIVSRFPAGKLVKIKFEVDTQPPGNFAYEKKLLLIPRPFMVNAMTPSSLFAGKMHAILCRKWANRPKGRDWYDLVWYVSRATELDIGHLEARLRQSCRWQDNDDITFAKTIDKKFIIGLLKERIESLDITAAKEDVIRFIADKRELDLWSKSFFAALSEQIAFV